MKAMTETEITAQELKNQIDSGEDIILRDVSRMNGTSPIYITQN